MKFFTLLLFLILANLSFSADRYWIAAAAGNWSNTANWSTTSGGAGGASVPGAADRALFNANGLGNCNVDIAVTLGGISMNGYTAQIELNGNPFNITSGNSTLSSGTILDSPNLSAFSINSAGTTTFNGTTFGAQVNCTSGRVYLNGSVFNNVAFFTKSGANNDASSGGNTFNTDVTIANTSSGYFLLGNGSADAFGGNVIINNSGTDLVYLAYNSAGNTIAGNLSCNNSSTATGIRIASQTASEITITGNVDINLSGSADGTTDLGANGDVTVNGTLTYSNTSTAASTTFRVANGTNSTVLINGAASFNNGGTGITTQRVYIGDNGDVTFNSTLELINNSAANNSQIYLNRSVNSVNNYNDNITVQSTIAGCDGIFFGQNSGSGTLAATKTITVGVGGFIDGNLQLRNFTQTGATAQAITLTGTSTFTIYDSNFGGNVDFNSPRITTRGTTYSGTASIEKTGAGNDNSVGGNNFVSDVTFVNSGSGEMGMGNGTADTYGANVDITNSGTSNFRLAYNSAGNTVAGNITALNTGSANNFYLSSNSASTLTVAGNVTFTDSSNDTDHDDYIGNAGDLTIGGDLSVSNISPGDRCDIFVASNADSQVDISGTATFINNGTGAIVSRIWIGNQGDVIFDGPLNITNSSASTNSRVYLNYSVNSANQYNDNIVLLVDNAASDGITFGENTGTGTLAAGRTITIGGGGFVAGDLRFRNFTQVGGTAQALSLSGTARIYNYDSNWGGNIVFDAPRILTRGTTYNGTAELHKSGGIGDDASVGGNTFVGNAILRNSGDNYLLMGNGSPDDFQADLDVINSGTDEIYVAYNSTGNTIAGNLTVTQSGSALRTDFSSGAASTLTVTGTTIATNSSNAATNQLYFGNNGSIDFDDALSISTSSSGTNSYVYVANGTSSIVTVDGPFTFTHGTTATNNSRSYIGNNGDITFNDVVTINNNTVATSSDIYLNHSANSSNLYNHNIIVSESVAGGDGIRFGQNGGAGTLAAGRTVSIGVGGFISGDLRFRNFTQVGPTAQTLVATGTARIYNYDSNWGGDIDFTAPRMLTEGTTYNLTTSLEKSGGVGDDASAGGNTFVGNATLMNSGDNYFMMGNGSADDFQSDLVILNNGSDDMYIAHNSAGNNIGGTLDITLSNTADRIELCDNANSTLTVTGAVTVNNTSTSVTNVIVFADNGDIDFDNDVTIDNNGAGTTNRVTIANGTNSSVSIDGAFTFNHLSTATNDSRAYIGNNGDVIFNGAVTMANATSANNSQIYCNNTTNSSNQYNNDIILSCTDGNSDGIRFGEAGGAGTLSAGNTVSIGVGGFVAGDLRFRNFTQVGGTVQALTCTGTARIYNYDSNWGGNVTFIAPRMLTRGTTYNGTSYLEKTSVSNDQSVGGNTFVGNSELRHSGSNQFLMGNGTADVWQANLTVVNSGNGNMYVGYAGVGHSVVGTLDWTRTGSAVNDYVCVATGATMDVVGNATFLNTSNAGGSIYISNNGTLTFNADVSATNSPNGAVSGQIRLAEGGNSTLIIDGLTTLINNGTSTTSQIILGNNGLVDLNNDLDVSNVGSGTSSYFYLCNGTTSSATIDGTTTFSQSGGITTTRAYLGNQGDIVFNGDLTISNNSSSTNSEVYLNYNANSVNLYNGNILVSSENASCDGVRFGQNTGVGTLSAGNTVSVSGGGFVAGDLRFRNWTQVGGTVQNIVCTGTARIYQQDAVWNADAAFTAPRYYTRSTTYNGTTDITKNGASNDDSPGDNVFNQTTTITNSGSGRLRFSATNTLPDDYNADVTFVQSGAGNLQPSYNNTDTYAGHININTTSQLYFGQGGNGRVLMDGGAGDQDMSDLGASPLALFRDLQINKASGDVNLNMPIEITVELDLDLGRVNTTSTNLLSMRDNSTVSSVSNASHVDGPIEKIGNDAFTFPVGDSSLYRPISISAPGSGAARFRAEYYNEDPHPTYNHNALAGTINHISSCEYWLLDRIASTNDVVVTLSWDTPASCGVDNLPELIVARWDGALWQDHGNGGTTGNSVSGTVMSSAPVTNFSPFTLASTTSNNPLPVELVEFTAKLNKDVVDLNWSTASETNNDYFEVQRSYDGENWEYLTTIDGAGTTVIQQDYMTKDLNPYAGISYYRLKQFDFNGDFEYSNTESVEVPFNNTGNLTVYPNPTNDIVYVIGAEDEIEFVLIFNALGEQIQPHIQNSNGQLSIDLSNYESGIYFIQTTHKLTRIIKN